MFRRRTHRTSPIRRRALLGTALAVSVVAAPAALGGGAGAATSSTATSTPPVQKKTVLTKASDGTTTSVTEGEVVVVKLASNGLQWTEASVSSPSAKAPAVLRKKSGRVNSDGSSVTRFLVVGYGSADLQATGTPKCATGVVCPPYVVRWQATVDSPAVDPPAPAA